MRSGAAPAPQARRESTGRRASSWRRESRANQRAIGRPHDEVQPPTRARKKASFRYGRFQRASASVGRGARPRVELAQAERDGHEEQREERAASRRRPPRRAAPTTPQAALHRGVDEHEVEAAEGDREEVDEGHEPRREHALRGPTADDERDEREPRDGHAEADERQARPRVPGREAGGAGVEDAEVVAHALLLLTRPATRAAAAPASRSSSTAARGSKRGSLGVDRDEEAVVRSRARSAAEENSGWWCRGRRLRASMPSTAPRAPPRTESSNVTGTYAGHAKKRLAADHERVREECTHAWSAKPPAPPTRAPRQHDPRQRRAAEAHGAVEAVHREGRVRVPAREAGVAHQLAGPVESGGGLELARRAPRRRLQRAGAAAAPPAARRTAAVVVRRGLGQDRLHLRRRHHRREAHEQAEEREEETEAADEARDVPDRRAEVSPRRGQEVVVERGHDDDEALEPHPDVDEDRDREEGGEAAARPRAARAAAARARCT